MSVRERGAGLGRDDAWVPESAGCNSAGEFAESGTLWRAMIRSRGRAFMNHLNWADWLVIVGYLGGIIAFGMWFGREQKTTRDYFLGSRNIPWWGVGFSIVATETSALTFIGVPAMAYGPDNLGFMQIVIGYVLARIILAVVMVPHYFRGEIYSPYQLLGDVFGHPARRTIGLFFLMAGTLAAGVRVYVTCIPLQLMVGYRDDQILWVILLFVGLSWIYTFVGGVKAVIWTDAVQFFLFMAGGLFALCYIPTLVAGGWSGALAKAGAAGKLDWLNASLTLGKPFNLWMGVVGATFQVMSSHGADQLVVQRVLTCSSVTEGRKALVLSAVIIFPLFLMFLLTGTMLWVYYQQFPQLPIPVPEVRPGVGKYDYIFPIFILTAMPNVVKGFLIVAILSAAMSSVSSALSALAAVSMTDLFKVKAETAGGEAAKLKWSRYSTAFWAVMLIVVAYLTKEVESVLNAAFSLSGLTSGAMLGGLLLALNFKRGRAVPVIAGMVASLAGMICLVVFMKPAIAWPWFTMIGTAITVVVALLVNAVGGSGEDRPERGGE